nr:cyclin-T1-3-like isoform X1 [Tanacetum cinerariifolium]
HNDGKQEENSGGWYFSWKELEENSPSRPDGTDLKRETYLRKSYCTLLQDLGMRLKVQLLKLRTFEEEEKFHYNDGLSNIIRDIE